jgi:hypothetical protein
MQHLLTSEELQALKMKPLLACRKLSAELAHLIKEKNGVYTIDPAKASKALTEFQQECETL